jgi:DNA glycosylase AlkZ-like
MTIPEIAIARLYNQQLESGHFTQPGEVVRWLVAVQAQDYAGGKWSVGLRLPRSHEIEIEQAIRDKAILRTWSLRGTLQFVAPTDIRWLNTLIASRVIARNARRYRELELDSTTLRLGSAILAKSLEGGRQLNRIELGAILEQSGISVNGQRLPYLLQRAALEGLICQVEMRRNIPNFIALDQSIPRTGPAPGEESLAELARRYFISRGPATLQDFVWWSGLLTADAVIGVEAVKSQLTQQVIEGQTYWGPPSPSPSQDHPPTAYLLPGYDEFLIGYKDRSASLDPADIQRVSRGNGFFSTIAVNGQILGTWRRTFKKGTVVIELDLFNPPEPTQGLLLAAATRRYADYLEMDMEY